MQLLHTSLAFSISDDSTFSGYLTSIMSEAYALFSKGCSVDGGCLKEGLKFTTPTCNYFITCSFDNSDIETINEYIDKSIQSVPRDIEYALAL